MKKNKDNTAEIPKAVIIICIASAIAAVLLATWFLLFHGRNADSGEKGLGTSVCDITDADGNSDTVVLENITDDSPFLPVDTDPLETTGVVQEDTGDASGGNTAPLAGAEIGAGITLVDIGAYSGPYVEDGSDDNVQNVLSVVVRNDGERDIQYAEVYVSVDDVLACFRITTLPVGVSVTALESTRMEYTAGASVTYAKASNVAYYTEMPSMYGDIFTVTGCSGYINLSNNSDIDINSDVVVYYKAVKDGAYFGGITYSVRASGGIGAKSSTLLAAPHFSLDSCKVLFIKYEK